jgi:hypothetical protein
MIFPPLLSMSVIGVADAGVPNSERLVMRPMEPLNIAKFGVLVGIRVDGGNVFPMNAHLFWFGDIEIIPAAWIVLYTKPGTYDLGTHTDGAPVHSFFWNRDQTLFNIPEIVPVVFEMSAIQISGRLAPPTPPPRPAIDPSTLAEIYKALNAPKPER